MFATGLLMLACSDDWALDLAHVSDIKGLTKGSVFDKFLADQQIKDGQFEFKTGKAEFAPGNAKRSSGLLKILTGNSQTPSAIPNLHVTAEGRSWRRRYAVNPVAATSPCYHVPTA